MNEKLIETLFNRFALQRFRFGEAWVHTPSSREEFVNGYDSRIVGLNGLREIIFQFKKPRPIKSGFTISTTPHQHKTLRILYPPRTAYYVSATFRDFTEIQQAQRQIKQATDFLKYYVAIDIHDTLPDDVTFIQYERLVKSWSASNVRFKRDSDGNAKKATHAVSRRGGWESGVSLIDKFKRQETGSVVQLIGDGKNGNDETSRLDARIRECVWRPRKAELERAAESLHGAELPTALGMG